MPLTNYTEYVNRLKENRSVDFQMSASTGRSQRLTAGWRQFVPAPIARTTSVALDKDSAESLGPMPAVGSGNLELLGARLNATGASGLAVILADVVNLSGGLNATVITAQTTGLPTAALTRYTSGEGVMAAIYIDTAIGTTATTFTVSYTNQAGTPGQISTVTTIGSTGFREAGALILIPLAAGDTGVRSVESVTLAASTATAGNFGVCLFKPLAMLSMESFTGVAPLDMVSTGGVTGQFADINPNACLSVLLIQNAIQAVVGSIILNEV
jgi:hypothetical protein